MGSPIAKLLIQDQLNISQYITVSNKNISWKAIKQSVLFRTVVTYKKSQKKLPSQHLPDSIT